MVIDCNRGVTQSEVCETLGIWRANFVAIIDDLEKRGSRGVSSPADRRSKALALTPAGQRVLARAAELQRAHETRVCGRLGPAAASNCSGCWASSLTATDPRGRTMSASATVEYAERIALVTVSNPPVNTISSAVRDELHRALDRLEPRWKR